MKNKTLSVVIPTSGKRVNEIVLTLRTILKVKDDILEVIVINQGDADFEKKVLRLVNFNKKIHWYNQKRKGKSKALNFAVNLVKGDVFVIVDDDVIVSKDCFKVIGNEFSKDSDLAILFGKIKPYEGDRNGFVCPSLSNFSKSRQLTLDKLFTPESQTAGAIMVIDKNVLKEAGGFCEWLGVGSWMGGGEEWEFAYRLVLMGKKIILSPKLVVYHNRFLKTDEYIRLMRTYFMATAIFCFYLAIKYKNFYILRNWNLFRKQYQQDKGKSFFGMFLIITMVILPGSLVGLFLNRKWGKKKVNI